MKTLNSRNIPSVAIGRSVADGQSHKLLGSLEAENAELRDNVVVLMLQIQELHQELHNGPTDLRSITFSMTGTPISWSSWAKPH